MVAPSTFGTFGRAAFCAALLVLSQVRFASAAADLTLSGSGPGTSRVALSATYSFTVTNAGPDAASGVVLDISAPSGFNINSGNSGGATCNFTYVSGIARGWHCTDSTLASGGSFTATISGQFTATGTQTATASVTATTADSNTSNNSAQATTVVAPASADLLVGVSAAPRVLNGTSVEYSFGLGNSGPDLVLAVTGTLMLPPEVATPPTFSFWGGGGSCTHPGATVCGRSPITTRPDVMCWFPGDGGANSVTCQVSDGVGIGPAGYGSGQVFIHVNATTVGTAVATATVQSDPNVIDTNATNNSDTASVIIDPMADLSLVVDSPGNAVVGQNFAYTATASNAGPNEAVGTTLTLTLPASVSLTSASGATCSGNPTVTCTLGTIASGGSRVITVNVAANATGQATASGTLASTTGDADTADLKDDATTTITTASVTGTELQVVGSASPPDPFFTQPVTFSFVLTNNGPDPTGNLSIVGTLPAGMPPTYLSGGTGGGTCSFTGNPYTGFTCALPSLANADTRTISVGLYANVLATRTATLTATTTAPDRNTSNNSASVTVTVQPANADVAVGLGAPSTINLGSTLEYTLGISNNGPDSVQTISASLILPPEVSTPPSFNFWGGGGGCTHPGATVCGQSPFTTRPGVTCWFPGNAGPRSVTCEVHDAGGIGPDGSGGTGGSAFIRVNAATVGVATATAATDVLAGIGDSNAANDTATATTRIVNPGETDIKLTKTAPTSALLNNQFDYTLTVRNVGPNPATNVTVADQLPTEVAFVSASVSGGSCTGTSLISCTISSLGASQSKTITIRVTAKTLGNTTNTATASATETDPDASNNQASASVEIRQLTSDIAITATGPATTEQNRRFTLQLRVQNLGPDSTSNVRVHGTLPAGLALSYGNYDCFSVAAGFECFVGSLYSNQSDYLSVALEPSTVGPQQIGLTVTQNNTDPDSTNDAVAYDVTVVPRPKADIGVALSVPTRTLVGGTVVYTMTITNAGPDPATGVSMSTAFPMAAFDNESVTSTPTVGCNIWRGGATIGSGIPATIVVCSRPTMQAGETVTLAVSARALLSGSHLLTAQASGSGLQDDPDRSNNVMLSSLVVADPLTIACPSDLVRPTDAGAATAVVITGTPTTTNGLPPVSIAGTRSDGLSLAAAYPLGTTTIAWAASDTAGQQAQCSQTIRVEDREPPRVLCGTPDGVWHASNVSIACTASDAASGLANAGQASFVLSTSVAAGAADANAPTASAQVCDVAGNCTVAGPIGGNLIDRQSPVIDVSTPADGASFVLNAAVASSFTCSDGSGSGIAACTGPSAVLTSSPGGHTFVVTATDKVGNGQTATPSYSVVYASGMCEGDAGRQVRAPIDPGGASVFKQGRTVPVKFRVCDASGASVGAPGTVARFALVAVVAGTATTEVNQEPLPTTPNDGFRWDAVERQWIFNLSTSNLPAGQTYFYRIVLNDGTFVDFRFGLR